MIHVQVDEHEPTLRWVILDRAKPVNALDEAMVAALDSALTEAEHDGVRTLAIRSAQRHFCAGLDLGAIDIDLRWRDAFLLQHLTRIASVLEHWRTTGVVTAAVVHGGAFGAGADLSLACQHRIAVAGATWTFPGVQFGISLGTARLAQIVGADRARSILLSQATVHSQSAQDWGLVHDVVPDADAAIAEVRRYAGQVARLTPESVATIFAITENPSRDAAIGALARSASTGSVSARIRDYREALRRA